MRKGRQPLNIEIDEAEILASVNGDRFENQIYKAEKKETESQSSSSTKINDRDTSNIGEGYEKLFLKRTDYPSSDRTIRVSNEIHQKIIEFLKRVCSREKRNIKMTDYVNNILEHHMDIYKTQINNLYNECQSANSNKPLIS